MSRIQRRILEMTASSKMRASGRAGRENGHYTSSGLLSWYFARPETRGLTYALTVNGYVLLS